MFILTERKTYYALHYKNHESNTEQKEKVTKHILYKPTSWVNTVQNLITSPSPSLSLLSTVNLFMSCE